MRFLTPSVRSKAGRTTIVSLYGTILTGIQMDVPKLIYDSQYDCLYPIQNAKIIYQVQ
jgi:hypothetical protein